MISIFLLRIFQIYQVKNFLYGNFSHHLDGGEYAVEGVFGAGYVEVVAL